MGKCDQLLNPIGHAIYNTNIASYHGIGPLLASIFIAAVVFWPLITVFLVVAFKRQEPQRKDRREY